MPVSDENVMAAMQGGASPADASAPPPTDSEAPPMGAPMSTPEPKQGNREAALVKLGMALDLIEQSLPDLGSESQDGQKIMAALRSLHGVLGPRKGKTGELQSSEILGLMQSLPQGMGGPPGAAPSPASASPQAPSPMPPTPAGPMPGAGGPPPM